MQRMEGLPLVMLAHQHGVPEEHVKVLVRAFGSRFPAEVDGPGPAIRWLLAWLPWERTHPLLRKWFELTVKKSMDFGDARIQAVFGLLRDDVEFREAARVQDEALQVTQRLAAIYGKEGVDAFFKTVAMTPDSNPTLRMWAGALPITDAAKAAACRRDDAMVNGAFGAVFCLARSHDDGLSDGAVMDSFVRDTAAALAEYVCTWSGQWSC